MKYSKLWPTAAGALIAGVSLCINADTVVSAAGPAKDVLSHRQSAGTDKPRPWMPLMSYNYRELSPSDTRPDTSGCVPGVHGWGWLGERDRSNSAPGGEHWRGQVYRF